MHSCTLTNPFIGQIWSQQIKRENINKALNNNLVKHSYHENE